MKSYRRGSVRGPDFSEPREEPLGGQRFEGLYRGWKNVLFSESGIRQEFGTNDRKRKVEFGTFC